MIQPMDAIYDNGVLKPLEPLALSDQARVKLTVDAEPVTEPADKLAKQKAALRELWEEIDKLPQHHNNDGWSVRQHGKMATSASSTDFWDNPEDDEVWNNA
ncbi:MAG: antitoxin family protein [Pirellulales bacterium]